ncbi:phosphotransferase enzyme family protein [Arthrobacter mobilis]|uniref:Phosphotransferase n=1 Tax=Arthrobacter mobilis TaxID=2724944 RepID=A0A7X6HB80_9MICC|nr:phosphotransferase [Arthrobacter mobilis]NKX53884.1 phosphotransferase [Arthrobacter mobilis]
MDTEAAIRAVRGALKLYGFEETSGIDLVKYRENYVFRLTRATGDSYAVRLHRAGYRTDAQIRTELAYLQALGEQGVSVPEMVPTLDGNLMCLVRADDGTNLQLDVQRWIDAAHPLGDVAEALTGESALEPETFRLLGALTAELHDRTSAIGRLPGFDRGAWDAGGLVGDAALWGNPLAVEGLASEDAVLLETAMARLKRDLEALDASADRYGVIHADLTPENVLVQDGRMIVIDFDDFGEGWHLFDLATILFFYQPHPRYEAYRQALIDGYGSVRALPERFLDPWDAMLLARGLTYLGWAGERKGDAEAAFIAGQVVPVVLGLAAQYTSAGASRAGTGS